MNTPPLHPEWLIKFWLTTPGIRSLEPHLTSVIVLFIISIVVLRYFWKVKVEDVDDAELRFQHLMQKKRIIDEQINELKSQFENDQIDEETYEEKLAEYEKLLEDVKQQLLQFIQ